jgi:hypothetical protein
MCNKCKRLDSYSSFSLNSFYVIQLLKLQPKILNHNFLQTYFYNDKALKMIHKKNLPVFRKVLKYLKFIHPPLLLWNYCHKDDKKN